MQDLKTLIPPICELLIANETLALTPLRVGQLPAFLCAITPVIEHLKAPEIDWLGLICEHGHDLLTAIAIAAGKSRAWVDALSTDEAITLAAKLIQLNADFFTKTVVPKLNALFVPISSDLLGSTPASN